MAAAATVRMVASRRHPQCAAVQDGRPGSSVIWDPEEMRGLALPGCRECWGAGVKWRLGPRGRPYPCGCALRAIFRQCLTRYRRAEARIGSVTTVRLTLVECGGRRCCCWGRPEQEYCADFVLLGRRVLTGLEYRIFRLHFIFGRPWSECVRRLGIDRDRFFRQVYLVEQRLGYTLRTVKPYGLHPVGEYFYGILDGGMK